VYAGCLSGNVLVLIQQLAERSAVWLPAEHPLSGQLHDKDWRPDWINEEEFRRLSSAFYDCWRCGELPKPWMSLSDTVRAKADERWGKPIPPLRIRTREELRRIEDMEACVLKTNTVRVGNLSLKLPIVTQEGRVPFEAVTSFPGKQSILQASPNLSDWVPISTNLPSNNTFTFTDPNPATNSQRFYRALVPP